MLSNIANGQELLDTIYRGGSDQHQFAATAADTVRVSLGETDTGNGFAATPLLQVIGPDGSVVDSDTDPDAALVQFQAEQTGTYSAIISDTGKDDTLSYRVRVVTLPGTPELIEGRDSLLGAGREVNSKIALGGFNLHRFEATSAATVRVSLGETDTGSGLAATPLLQVIGPDGSIVGADKDPENAFLQFSAEQTGTYTAIVSDAENNNTLSYRFRAVALPGTPELIEDRDAVLSNGQEVESEVAYGSFNLHQFDATSAATVRVSLGEADAGSGFAATPLLQVIGPDGSVVDSDTDPDAALVQFQAEQTGTYTAIVSDTGNDNTMSYRLRAVALPGSPELIDGRDGAPANGREVESEIALGGFNLHQIDATTTATVRVSLGETDTGSGLVAEPLLQVIGPDGSVVATDRDPDNAFVQFSAEQAGTYTAVVSDTGNDNTMSYRLRAVALPGSPELIEGRDSLLGAGREVESEVAYGSFNLHRFDATAMVTVRVSLEETDAGSGFAATPLLQVIGPDGSVVESDTDPDSAIAQFKAEQTGTYTAIVSDTGNDDTLSYNIVATGVSLSPTIDGDAEGDSP